MTAILGNHMTARELRVKWRPQLACLLSKLQPDRTFYGGIMGSQARVPQILTLFIINSAREELTHELSSQLLNSITGQIHSR